MANLSVLVSLGPVNNPVLTLKPEELDVPPGTSVITWSIDPESPIQNFTFTSLGFIPPAPPCFVNQHLNGTQISIQDNNTVTASYGYILGATYNGRIYTAGGEIGSAAPRVGGMGSPTIHNK
jgi:hypothetical protein